MTNKTKLRIMNLALVACVVVVVGTAAILFLKIKGSRENQAQLDNLAGYVDAVAGGASDNGGSGGDSNETEKALTQEEILALRRKRLAGYQELQKTNGDMVGWIRIQGTKVDYPVMQTLSDPDFYLKHNFEKQKSVYGTPYLSVNCDVRDEDNNLVVYGHHMKDGSMFAGLKYYDDVNFFKEHPIVQFDTMDTPGDYQIIGTFAATALEKEKALYEKMLCRDEAEFNDYVSEVKRRSYFDTGETAVYGDELITLITCEYTHKEGRLFVVAKRIGELRE